MSTKRLHILVAEDNDVNQFYISTLLRKEGHLVTVAEDGVEAVNAIKGAPHETYDVVLMDIHMPNMDGLAANKKIRALPDARSRVPIIALTANAMTGDREFYLGEGMDEYVSKPIDVEKLSAALVAVTGEEVNIFGHKNTGETPQSDLTREAETALADFLDTMADDGEVSD